MSHTLTFTNHSPVKIADVDLIEDVWTAKRSFGHFRLRRYTTKRGNALYWISQDSGREGSRTTRKYLRNAKEIREYFEECDMLDTYHLEIETLVDEGSVLDIDA